MLRAIQMDHILVDPSRPVVFLDMCGVLGDTWLVREDWAWDRRDRHRCRAGELKGDVTIAASHDLLIDIFRRFNAQIIVVSSWLNPYLGKDHPDVLSFAEFLGYEDVLGSLHTSGGPSRGETVKDFVRMRGLVRWAVIDDSKEQMYLDQTFFTPDHFVHPDARFGFWQKEAEHLTLILGGSSVGTDWEREYHGMSRLKEERGLSSE